MKKTLRWLSVNGIMAVVIYLWYVQHIEGAYNIMVLMIGVTTFVSLFALRDDTVKILAEKGRAVPAAVDVTYDVILTLVFAWYGDLLFAAIWVFHIAIVQAAYEKAKDLK